MKACTVEPGKIESARVDEVDEPSLDDGDVLVEGLLVGICGTDIEISKEGYGEPPPGRERMTLFHESLGRVLDAPANSGLQPGDLVAGVVRRPDPEPCICCANDQWDFCRNGKFTERGIKRQDGYGSQRWRVTPKFAIKLDAHLGDHGVLLEPTSVVAKAWDQVERIAHRSCWAPEHVLVTGAGPIGLLAALLGVQRGLQVDVLDRVTEGVKPGLVADLGANYINSLDDLTAPPDVVIECTGIGTLVFQILEMTAPNAITCLTGISSGVHSVPIEADLINKDLVLGNDVVFGSVNAGLLNYQQAAEALAMADVEWLGRLITRRVPIGSWTDALERAPDDVKVVVDLQA